MTPLIAITPQSNLLPNRDRRLRQFVDAIVTAGGEPLPLEGRSPSLPRCQGLLLIGGGDAGPSHFGGPLSEAERSSLTYVDESLDVMELRLVDQALANDLPVLGVCRGMQMINLARGGTLLPDIKLRRPDALNHEHPDPLTFAHAVVWEPKTRLGQLLHESCSQVNSTHHQAIDGLGEGLQVAGRAPDGIVEAIERPASKFFCGVQFHPERMMDLAPHAARLFDVFVAAAGKKNRR